MADIKTELCPDAVYSVSGSNLIEDQTIETAVYISLFTDARAGDSRGWWGGDIGSKRWSVSRAKQDDETLRIITQYDQQALQHFIDSGYATEIDVTAEWASDGTLNEYIKIYKQERLIANLSYEGV